jgi:serine/threonine-protein kinase SRPK3
VPAVVSLSNVNVSVEDGADYATGVLQPAPLSSGIPSAAFAPLLAMRSPQSPQPDVKKRWMQSEPESSLTPASAPLPVDEATDTSTAVATPSHSPSATTTTTRTASPFTSSPTPTPPSIPDPIHIKIADLGNATPSGKHFTEDIQTRQYRSPEAIMGRRDWDCKVDIWSVACLVFELLTAEYLFDPQGQGNLFTKDDDHMAQIIELLGDFSSDLKAGGRYTRDLFGADGSLRYIKTLKPWPLEMVMIEKYGWMDEDARELWSFWNRC